MDGRSRDRRLRGHRVGRSPGVDDGLPRCGSLGFRTPGRRSGRLARGAQRPWDRRRAGRGRLPPRGRPRLRRLRGRLDPAVRVDRVRERRGPSRAPALQLRRPAAALDLRGPPGRRRFVLAREPGPGGRAAALPVRGGPADRRLRPARRRPAGAPPGHGPRGGRRRRARPAALGRAARGRRLPLLGRARRVPGPLDGPRGGLPVRGGVEEPLPGAPGPAARLPPRAAGGPAPPVVVAAEAAARRARPSGLGRGPRVGGAAPRSPTHVPVRFAALRHVGDRRPPRGRRAVRPRVGCRPGRLVGVAGHRRLPRRVARGLGAGLGDGDDGLGEPRRLPPRELRPLPAAGPPRCRPGPAREAPRGAPGAGPGPRDLLGPVPRAPRAVGVGQHEGAALVLRGGPGADRHGRAGSARPAVEGGPRGRPAASRGR